MRVLYNPLKTSSPSFLATNLHRNTGKTHLRLTSALPGEWGEEIELVVPSENVIPAVETIMWRFQTSLPIVKVEEVRVYAQSRLGTRKELLHISKMNRHSLQNFQNLKEPFKQIKEFCESCQQLSACLISLQIQDILCRLSDISILPFAHAIFLLKEMLVGFEALIDVFGFFEPKDCLVTVTPQGKWKLWMDQNLGSHQKKQCNLSEQQFIYMLISMAQNHCKLSQQSKSFFHDLKQYTSKSNCTFLKTLAYIRSYVGKNKIYQVTRIMIDQNFGLKGHDGRTQARINSIRSFSNPFANSQNIESKFKRFLFKKVPPRDKDLRLLTQNISPIVSPGVSRQSSFAQIGDKWLSPKFMPITPTKPSSQLSKPQKRPNMRKYSEQCTKVQSLQNLYRQRGGSSTAFNVCLQEASFKRGSVQSKSKQYSSHKELQSFHSIHNPSLSPHNTSSTKQMGLQEDKYESNYKFLKIKDLGNRRVKNNKSLINNKPHIKTAKPNMTISHQFPQNRRSDSEDEVSPCKPREGAWVNRVSDLFSDTVSIKQLKGSIRLKGNEDELFQKEYLKDVKLDLLQKFGRKVNAPVTVPDGEEDAYHRKHDKQNYQSMQLIEQQFEEAVSHVEQDTRLDDMMASQSIRSRKYTHNGDFFPQGIGSKGELASGHSRRAESSVFHFETQMFCINPKSG